MVVNGKEFYKFKDSNKNVNFPNEFCLRGISNKFSYVKAEEVSLKGNVYDFSVDYKTTNKSDIFILNIHKYLMNKNGIGKMFITALTFVGCDTLKCVSMSDQKCKVRPAIMNINSVFYPYSVLVNKCSGSCDGINDLYAELSVFDVVKNVNAKVFNLMSRTNETRYVSWHESCGCKCRLDASVCNENSVGIVTNLDVNIKN